MHPKLLIRSLLVFVVVFLSVAAAEALAVSHYVSPQGNDGNIGSVATPFRTISRCVERAAPGDTCFVLDGVYEEHVRVDKSGQAGAPITIQASGNVETRGFSVRADHVNIIGFLARGKWDCSHPFGILYDGTFGRIEGNEVTEFCNAGILAHVPWNDAANPRTNNVTIVSNKIYNSRMVGIEVRGDNNLVDNNEIYDIVQVAPDRGDYGDADGIRYFGSNHVIRKNNIHDIAFAPTNPYNDRNPHIDCFQSWGPATNITIEQNYCEVSGIGNAQGAYTKGFQLAAQPEPISNITIRNNVLVSMEAMYCEKATNVSFLHNLHIDDHGYRGLHKWAEPLRANDCTGLNASNNIFINPHDAVFALWNSDNGGGNNFAFSTDGQTPTGESNATDRFGDDPQLVNFAGGDYHLSAGSPLIDAGRNVGVTNDFDGFTRPAGAGTDVGPYEFGSTGIAPTATPFLRDPGNLPTPTFPPPTITNTPGPTSLECDACGYCEGLQPPPNYESCVQCLYGDTGGDPANPNNQLNIPFNEDLRWTVAGCVENSISGFVNSSVDYMVIGMSSIAFLIILYGGFTILTSQDDKAKLETGKRLITGAVVGLVISLFATFLLRSLGVDILRIPGLTP